MISQEKVDAHVNRVERLTLSFETQVSREVDRVAADVSEYVLKTLSVHRGVVVRSPENAQGVLAIEDVFQESLNVSDYYPTVLAFVESFADQVSDFDSMHEGTPPSSRVLTPGDRDMLSSQASVAVAILEGHSTQGVLNELRQLLARSLGSVLRLSELAQEINAIVRKMSHVGPIGKDQANLWHRLLCSLAYRRVEEQGTKLAYTYAGPRTSSTRGFCSKLLSGNPLTLGEVAALDNGQTQDAFLNGGGFGCSHFWFGEALEVGHAS